MVVNDFGVAGLVNFELTEENLAGVITTVMNFVVATAIMIITAFLPKPHSYKIALIITRSKRHLTTVINNYLINDSVNNGYY